MMLARFSDFKPKFSGFIKIFFRFKTMICLYYKGKVKKLKTRDVVIAQKKRILVKM